MQVARLLEPRSEPKLCCQAAPDRACGARSSARLSKEEVLALYLEPGALWRQSRRHPRRLACLFRQGAAAAVARRSGAAGGAAAVAGSAAARPLRRGRAPARDRVLDRFAAPGLCRRRDRPGQGRAGAGGAPPDADACAARGRSRRWPQSPARQRSPAHASTPTCSKNLEAACARTRAHAGATLGPDVSVAHARRSTMRAARCSRMSARRPISTTAAPARWI